MLLLLLNKWHAFSIVVLLLYELDRVSFACKTIILNFTGWGQIRTSTSLKPTTQLRLLDHIKVEFSLLFHPIDSSARVSLYGLMLS
jgi:hypothetical protein